MAAPQISHYSPEGETHTYAVAAATGTIDLPTPGAGQRHVIENIWIYCLGTITAFHVEVQLAAGTAFCKFGGQVGGATNGILPNGPLLGPIICAPADATKVLLVATGASSIQITVNLRKATA